MTTNSDNNECTQISNPPTIEQLNVIALGLSRYVFKPDVTVHDVSSATQIGIVIGVGLSKGEDSAEYKQHWDDLKDMFGQNFPVNDLYMHGLEIIRQNQIMENHSSSAFIGIMGELWNDIMDPFTGTCSSPNVPTVDEFLKQSGVRAK